MKCCRRVMTALFLLSGICLMTGCTKRQVTSYSNTSEETATTQEQQKKNEAVTGVITKMDEAQSQITITEVATDWSNTYQYTATTDFESRYGEKIAPSQLSVGDMVDIQCGKEDLQATAVKESYDSWEFEKVTGLTYNRSENQIYINGKSYYYTAALQLCDRTGAYAQPQEKIATADPQEDATTQEDAATQEDATTQEEKGQKQPLTLSDISRYDTVTCRGYKGKIYSVTLESGHGYVKLTDYSTYLGGMICIGEVMEPVTENMVLTVPVGEWKLEIDKNGQMGTKGIVVQQNQQSTVSLAELTIVACKKGIFHFEMDPQDATITIDGKEYTGRTDFVLEYGVHQVAVSAVDYKAYNGKIKLQVPYMNINVKLVPLDSKEDSDAQMNTNKTTKAAATTQQRSDASTATTAAQAADTQVQPEVPAPETETDTTQEE